MMARQHTIPKKLVLSHSGKGGVGKTTILLAYSAFLRTNNIPFVPFETDRENPGFLRRLRHDPDPVAVQMAIIAEGEEMADAGNAIINAALDAPEGQVIVDLPAAVTPALKGFIESNGILDILEMEQIELMFLFVTDGSPDSVTILLKHLEYFGDRASTCVLKNHGVNKHWEYFEGHSSLQALLHEHQVRVVDLPPLYGTSTMEKLKQQQLSFLAGMDAPQLSRIDQQRVRMFLKSCYSIFASLEVVS